MSVTFEVYKTSGRGTLFGCPHCHCSVKICNETFVRGWFLVVDYDRAPKTQDWSPQQDLFKSLTCIFFTHVPRKSPTAQLAWLHIQTKNKVLRFSPLLSFFSPPFCFPLQTHSGLNWDIFTVNYISGAFEQSVLHVLEIYYAVFYLTVYGLYKPYISCI